MRALPSAPALFCSTNAVTAKHVASAVNEIIGPAPKKAAHKFADPSGTETAPVPLRSSSEVFKLLKRIGQKAEARDWEGALKLQEDLKVALTTAMRDAEA